MSYHFSSIYRFSLIFFKIYGYFSKRIYNLGGFNDLIKMRDGWLVYDKNDKYIDKASKNLVNGLGEMICVNRF